MVPKVVPMIVPKVLPKVTTMGGHIYRDEVTQKWARTATQKQADLLTQKVPISLTQNHGLHATKALMKIVPVYRRKLSHLY